MAQILANSVIAGPFLSARSAMAELDSNGVVIGWSGAAERLLGYRASEVIGRSGSVLLEEKADRILLERCRAGDCWVQGLALRRRDGERVEVSARVSEIARAEEICWLVTAIEVSALGHWEVDQAILHSLLKQSSIGLAVVDTDLRYTWINEALERQGGVSLQQRLGRRISDVLPGLPVDAIEKNMRHVLETGKPIIDFEVSGHTWASSEPSASSTSYFRLEDPAGHVLGVCHVVIDSTARYRARQRLALLNGASFRIGTTLDIVRTAEELTEVIVPELADSVTVHLADWVLRAEDEKAAPLDPSAMGCAAARRADTVALADSATWPDGALNAEWQALFLKALAERRAVQQTAWNGTSIMAVPLIARGITLGVACFHRAARSRPFDEDDLLIADELGAHAAVSLDNARRFACEHTTALALQRSLLLQAAPRLSAVEFAHRYLPADAKTGAGGDWFDVIPLSGARVALVVGDVVGHGVRASAAMGQLRTAVRTLADLDLPPDELLFHLEDLVRRVEDVVPDEDDGGIAFVPGVTGATCLYAVYDPTSRRCSLARAGHPPPLIVHPDGSTAVVNVPPGLPLGVGSVSFESAEVEVPEGAVLALYTDGLVASRERDIDTGLEQLAEILVRSDGSLETACDAAFDALLPVSPPDDAALLLARMNGLAKEYIADWEVSADPSMVSEARRLVQRQLFLWGLEGHAFTTELIASELVTNAIRHAQPPLRLRLIQADVLTCEVSDGSSTSPHIRMATAEDEGGRGLFLIAQLAQRWGTRYTPAGKTIWAEQALEVDREAHRENAS